MDMQDILDNIISISIAVFVFAIIGTLAINEIGGITWAAGVPTAVQTVVENIVPIAMVLAVVMMIIGAIRKYRG